MNVLLVHLQLPQHYIKHAQWVWKENPSYFYNSPGIAKFFGPAHTALLHYCLLCGTFLLPLTLLFFIRKKIVSGNFLLAGFQLGISFFYSFLDVSYLYLYYTPVFVSLVIAGWVMGKKNQKN